MTDNDEIDQEFAAAQKAAEARLQDMFHRFFMDMEDVENAWEGYEGAGVYCGCETCLVREVLHAAWPHLKKAAELVAR